MTVRIWSGLVAPSGWWLLNKASAITNWLPTPPADFNLTMRA